MMDAKAAAWSKTHDEAELLAALRDAYPAKDDADAASSDEGSSECSVER